jgi:hypothetical protein
VYVLEREFSRLVFLAYPPFMQFSVTVSVTFSPPTPHTQRNGMQSLVMAILLMYHPVRWIGEGIRYWSNRLVLVFVNRRSSVQSGSPAPFFQELIKAS